MNRNRLIRALAANCKNGKSNPFRMEIELGLPAIPKWKYVLIRFPLDLLTNSTAAFVGSFTENSFMQVSSVDCCAKKAEVHFHGENVTGLPSLSHKPNDEKSYGPSFLPSNLFGAERLMHDVRQTFDWDEVIDFRN